MNRGEIIELGRHRLMCGDSTDADDVARLFGGEKPDLIFTSPPYLDQRDYGHAIPCWTTMMQKALCDVPHKPDTQILVNLGLVHRNGEFIEYWHDWMNAMQRAGWRKFGWYIWDKVVSLPGQWHGRLCPTYEFIFHFNKQAKDANKTEPCKTAGQLHGRGSQGGFLGGAWKTKGRTPTASHKIMDSVIKILSERGSRNAGGHPAMFPVSLPSSIHRAYTKWNDVIYDPFSGSGTSLIAADANGRRALAMELNPVFCDMVIARYRNHIEKNDAMMMAEARRQRPLPV